MVSCFVCFFFLLPIRPLREARLIRWPCPYHVHVFGLDLSLHLHVLMSLDSFLCLSNYTSEHLVYTDTKREWVRERESYDTEAVR